MHETDSLVQHLRNLISIDTTNPPGNEIEAARYMAAVLTQAGIEHEIVEPFPGRGSIVARLRGNGNKKPLLLLGHLDVVTADTGDWTYPPFSGQEAEGAIWGRGTLDMKGLVAIWLTLLLQLAVEGYHGDRDIILAATADEESGGRKGLGWIVENRPELVDCEWALNEGGGNSFRLSGKTFFTLQCGEKAGCPVKLIARGTAGHASIPAGNNPVRLLAEGLSRLSSADLPVHRTATTDAFLTELSTALGGLKGNAIRLALRTGQLGRLADVAFRDGFVRAGFKAMLSNTAVPTMLSASSKLNVVPATATADLDCRILPGQDRETLRNELGRILPAEIEINLGSGLMPTESDPATELAVIARDALTQNYPGSIMLPFLSPGATDARYLRPLGVTVYGFSPMLPGEPVNLAHGVDERISHKSLEFGWRVLKQVVHRATGHR